MCTSSEARMNFRVLPLEVSDFEQLVHHADDGEPGDDCVAPPNPVAWPVRTRTEAQTRTRYAFALQKRRFLEDPSVNFVKVVDDKDNIAAVARWHYYPHGYDYAREAHWEMAPDEATSLLRCININSSAEAGEYPPSNFNVALHNYILTERDSFRQHWIPRGKACWILMHMATRPSYRRQGAAAMLIKWGTERSAKENIPAYLEAGSAGRPIYSKYGFEQVGDVRKLSLAKFSVDMDFELVNMVFSQQETPGN